MTERRRPYRRGRGPRQPGSQNPDANGEPNPYREGPEPSAEGGPAAEAPRSAPSEAPRGESYTGDVPSGQSAPGEPGGTGGVGGAPEGRGNGGPPRHRDRGRQKQGRQPGQPNGRPQAGPPPDRPSNDRPPGDRQPQGGFQQNGAGQGRRNRRGGPKRDFQPHERPDRQERPDRGPVAVGPVVGDSESTGWLDVAKDGTGYVRRGANSYLADPQDAIVPMTLVRQYGLRRGDQVVAGVGRDARGRNVVGEIRQVNGTEATVGAQRPEFGTLVATYPERKLKLETGRPAKGGPELTRRAIDLIAPIGYGQRALIVAPARAGKTMLLQAILEGVATNHPDAVLLVLLVDERPEEVSEMITCGFGEVVASSFDMKADRHVDVADMVLERARRMVELGRDVVIVLDSITRLARAHNTAERGTGRTLSGGLDATAMARPKAFFGSARSVAPQHGGGSLTIIATALVETGSRMDDVIFEEFKGTGNCEIKLDRSLAEKRIFPAIDIGTSGTRREDKLFRPEQLEAVYTLRRGLQQMPSSSAMEWLIKRIGATPNNDALLGGL
jgi:transcription termination factor Rho